MPHIREASYQAVPCANAPPASRTLAFMLDAAKPLGRGAPRRSIDLHGVGQIA